MIYVLSGKGIVQPSVAQILVSYPSGSAVTATNGTDVVALNDTSGTGTIGVPSLGSWTVSCTDGANIKSQTVELTENGQTVTVSISYFEAYINVTVKGAPGSTQLSCSDGNNAYNHTLSANGDYQFTVYNKGTWTITGVRSDQTQSATVDVSTNGQIVRATLVYELVLFNSGNYADETGGWSSITNNKLDVSTSSTSMSGNPKHVYTKNPVDLSDYTTLHFILDSTSSSRDQWRKAGVSDTNTGSFNANVEINNSSAIGEHTLDISTINKSQYIHLACDAWPNQNGVYAGTSMVISKVWLS